LAVILSQCKYMILYVKQYKLIISIYCITELLIYWILYNL
jgi:hypothetical protein